MNHSLQQQQQKRAEEEPLMMQTSPVEKSNFENHVLDINGSTLPVPDTSPSKRQARSASSIHLRGLVRVLWLLSVLGWSLSIYLYADHFQVGKDHSFCDVNAIVSCTKLKQSAWSMMFGIPVAAFGVLWFTILVVLVGLYQRHKDESMRQGIAVRLVYYYISMGGVFVIYLLFAEYKVGVICPLCTAIHVITAMMFWIARKLHLQEFKFLLDPPSLSESLHRMRFFLYAGIFTAVTLLFVLYLAFQGSVDVSGNDIVASSPVVMQEGSVSTLLACTAKKGWVFYGSNSCGACKQQKDILGGHDVVLQRVNYVDCDVDQRCVAKSSEGQAITKYPTWILEIAETRKEIARKEGILSIEELSQLTGCPL